MNRFALSLACTLMVTPAAAMPICVDFLYLTISANRSMVPTGTAKSVPGFGDPSVKRRSPRHESMCVVFYGLSAVGDRKVCRFRLTGSPTRCVSSRPFGEGRLGLYPNKRSVVMAALLSISDINTSINHEPRMPDIRLAEALEFSRPRDIRKIILRHREALEALGEIVCATMAQTSKGGRPGKEYWLTKKQALYLCTKSETPNATDVTIRMVEVFDQVTNNASVAVRAHTRRKPSRSVAQPMRPAAEFAASIPLEDCLTTAHGHLRHAQSHYGTAQGARELDTALACLNRFKDEFERPLSLSSQYSLQARMSERRSKQ